MSFFQVGNALTNDYYDRLGFSEFWWSSGLISDQTYQQLNLVCKNESFVHPSESCQKVLEIVGEEMGTIDMYSIFTNQCRANASQINQLMKRKHVSVPFLYFQFLHVDSLFVFFSSAFFLLF